MEQFSIVLSENEIKYIQAQIDAGTYYGRQIKIVETERIGSNFSVQFEAESGYDTLVWMLLDLLNVPKQ